MADISAFPSTFQQAYTAADAALTAAEHTVADNQPVEADGLSQHLQHIAEVAKELPAEHRLAAQPILQKLLRRLDLIINQLVATADLYKDQRQSAYRGKQAAKAYVQAKQQHQPKPPTADGDS